MRYMQKNPFQKQENKTCATGSPSDVFEKPQGKNGAKQKKSGAKQKEKRSGLYRSAPLLKKGYPTNSAGLCAQVAARRRNGKKLCLKRGVSYQKNAYVSLKTRISKVAALFFSLRLFADCYCANGSHGNGNFFFGQRRMLL